EGAGRIRALAAQAAEFEMPAVGLTDHGSMAGAIELYREAGKAGVKPLLGCEVYVSDDRRAQTKGNAHLTLLAADNAGYGNLIKLASAGFLEGYYYKPRVDWELLSAHATGLLALSGCLSGRVCRALEESRPAHEALLCIQSGDLLKNPSRWKFDTDQFYFKSPQEMALDFPGYEHALRHTLEVAERCNVELELGRILLPKYPTPEGRDAFEYIV